MAVLGPVLARPVSKLLGVPLRMRGLSGELATRNATRNPKRTARTASSLMIGVALVGFMTVFAASAKSSIAGSLESDFTGTHIVTTGATDTMSGLSPDLADELRATPGVDVVSQARLTPAVIDGSATDTFFAFDAATVDEVFVLGRSMATSTHSAPTASPSRPSTPPSRAGRSARRCRRRSRPATPRSWSRPSTRAAPTGSARPSSISTRLREHGAEELDHRVYVVG